jgi:DTW domain-containing protein YfiP
MGPNSSLFDLLFLPPSISMAHLRPTHGRTKPPMLERTPFPYPPAPLPERELCFRCLRGTPSCYCASLRPFTPSFTVALLQHPKERKNPIGTARMTYLSIQGSLLIPGIGFEKDERVNALIADKSNYCVVLFPGTEAINLSEPEGVKELLRCSAAGTVKEALRCSAAGTGAADESAAYTRKLVVFVIDGTWSQAKGMIRKSPNLMALQKVRFDPETPSRYRIRKQPDPHCLSTLEAVHALVRLSWNSSTRWSNAKSDSEP